MPFSRGQHIEGHQLPIVPQWVPETHVIPFSRLRTGSAAGYPGVVNMAKRENHALQALARLGNITILTPES